MGSSRVPQYETTRIPTPSSVPGATDVSRGKTEESLMSAALERQRKRRGIQSTYRSGALADSVTGKTKLGE